MKAEGGQEEGRYQWCHVDTSGATSKTTGAHNQIRILKMRMSEKTGKASKASQPLQKLRKQQQNMKKSAMLNLGIIASPESTAEKAAAEKAAAERVGAAEVAKNGTE